MRETEPDRPVARLSSCMGPGYGSPFRDDTEVRCPTHPPLRSYGRLKSRTIKPRQAALMETLLPALRPPAGPSIRAR